MTKDREFIVVLPKWVKNWSKKHKPEWCPDALCTKTAGWSGDIGWCTGIVEQYEDLDMVSLCYVVPHENRLKGELKRILTKPDEALLMAEDIVLTCRHLISNNPQYKVDSDRLYRKNLKRLQRAKAREVEE